MKVENFDDWYELQNQLQKYKKEFPQFHKDFDVLENLIAGYIKRISQLSVNYNRNPSPAIRNRMQEYFDMINAALKEFEKSYMMLLLTKK